MTVSQRSPRDGVRHRPARALRTVTTVTTVTAAALALGLTACGSSGEGSGDDSAGSGGDFEPVSISHALGTAEITEKPERVVTLGQGSAETALALGTVPVGTESYEWGADGTGQLPWIHEELETEGVAEEDWPELLTPDDSGVSAEAVAALAPDVILAPWSGITQEQYDALSEIAPTVAYPEKAWTIDWRDQITTVATALGEKDRARELIDGIGDDFAAVREEHPEFAEHDFAFVYNQGASGDMGVFLPSEQRVAMVENLGLKIAPVVEDMKAQEKEGTDSAPFSLENTDLLDDVDLLFTFYSDPSNREEMEKLSTYGSIPAVRDGAVVAPTDNSFVTGSSMVNPLTVPWAIDRYVPMIGDAITHL